ncbi:hypothetical protein [Hymenobacter pini]|uniref:hypothetical protein n=1 Tax=Hymenobacter pini TaxID=2880879 RepID=UPI001CF0F079|nr:hypothetical protein [Hymenobacter pini]MCA8830301.1 hypothetical protein [Hymenobacter pini]
MKVLSNRTVYQCDHCTTKRFTKQAALRHEQFCKHNPDNRHACFSCAHLVRTTEEAAVDEQGKLVTAKRTVFTCAALRKDLYSYVAERKNMLQYVGEAERMPLQCPSYELDNPYPDAPFAQPDATDTLPF